MRAHTRKHHTKINVQEVPEEGYILAEKLIEEACKERPMWAIYLSGLRYREDLTQKQLSEMINVKQPNISLMERGKRPIGKDIAKRLAEVFNVDYRRFL